MPDRTEELKKVLIPTNTKRQVVVNLTDEDVQKRLEYVKTERELLVKLKQVDVERMRSTIFKV